MGGALHFVAPAPRKPAKSTPHLVPLTPALLRRARKLSRAGAATNISQRLAFRPGMSVALVHDNRVIGAGGLALYAGRLQAWMLVSRDARKRDIVAGVRLARRWLAIKAKEFPRIEIYVRALAPWRESFAAALDLKGPVDSGYQPEARDVFCLYLKEAG